MSVQFLIEQESRKYESSCMSAIPLVRRAKTMWDVIRATQVPVPSLLRGLHRYSRVGAHQQLTRAAEQQLGALLTAQLKAAAEIPDLTERKAFIGRLRQQEWRALQGYVPHVYRKAEMEGQRLLAKP